MKKQLSKQLSKAELKEEKIRFDAQREEYEEAIKSEYEEAENEAIEKELLGID